MNQNIKVQNETVSKKGIRGLEGGSDTVLAIESDAASFAEELGVVHEILVASQLLLAVTANKVLRMIPVSVKRVNVSESNKN